MAKEKGRTRRLIEEWLPIAEIGEESMRERRSMTALPPTYYLHVWWARRPLVASRAAVLASLLPADADREKYRHVLGIHGNPFENKERMAEAKRTGERFEGDAYSYRRAFTYTPSEAEGDWIGRKSPAGRAALVLDPTAGGGSVPFEASRLGCSAIANDLNPVAWLVLKATTEFPARFGMALARRFRELAAEFVRRRDTRLAQFFPAEANATCVATNWLWARTITCPYCGGLVPLSPNWRLNADGMGVRMVPVMVDPTRRHVRFEVATSASEHAAGTINDGDGICPFTDCARVIDGDEVKAQAQAGKMGDQPYAVVFAEQRVVGHTQAGKPKTKKIRGYRVPRPEDDVTQRVATALAERLPEWEATEVVPTEEIDALSNYDRGHRLYGMSHWRDVFAPRQLLGHCVSVEIFREIVASCGGSGHVGGLDAAALTYLAFSMDKMLNYNARMVRWHATREVVAGVFDRHDFAFLWSYAEMAVCAIDGRDWAIEQTAKALEELIELSGHHSPADEPGTLFSTKPTARPATPPVTITCRSADDLPHIATGTVDAVVMDPPYYDNVMYAELSDFFYVWLKRTAGLLYPEQFQDHLTDKDREAVANVAKFKDFSKVRGSGGAKKRAARDYQERMQAIFAEAKRVLKPDGILTLMFTHKATGAWDALAKGLIDAGFVITASWPIQTEAEGSLHIKDKNAAKSTIFLVCRPRETPLEGAEQHYWEDVEPRVAEAVRGRVAQFQAAGMSSIDLYLSCFGPALEVFSTHWPLIRGRPAQKPPPVKGAQMQLAEEEDFDPYAVRPEDALLVARRAVKEWRLAQLSTVSRKAQLDPVTEWFVLAWDAFHSAQFPTDEALKLARVIGVDFDAKLRGKVLEVKSNDVILWDSATRAKKGALGAIGGGIMLDVLHHAAHIGREKNTGLAREAIERAELAKDARLLLALQTVLEVLPTPRMVASNAAAPIAGAAADAAALEKLRRLAFKDDVPMPKQWAFKDAGGAGWTDS